MNEEPKIRTHYDYLLKLNSFLKTINISRITENTLEQFKVK